MRCSQEHTNISYHKFCTWLGPAIEPVEAFYFRHDSYRNPQYEANMKITVEPIQKNQKEIRQILTGNYNNLKEQFLIRIKRQYKTVKKALQDMDRNRKGFVTFDIFEQIISDWGFVTK